MEMKYDSRFSTFLLEQEIGPLGTRERAELDELVARIKSMGANGSVLECIERTSTDGHFKTFVDAIRNKKGELRLSDLRANPIYKALILWVRSWAKHDYHCHLSGSLAPPFVWERYAAAGTSPPDSKHFEDGWITSLDELKRAVHHVVCAYLADGVTAFHLRWNPRKRFDSEMKLDISKCIAAANEAIRDAIGDAVDPQPKIGHLFSLNRKKHAGEIIPIVEAIKSHYERSTNKDWGIDLSGPEVMEWEEKVNGDKLLELLADVPIRAAHLGTSRLDRDPPLEKRLEYIGRYITALSCENTGEAFRIGHGTILCGSTMDGTTKEPGDKVAARETMETLLALLSKKKVLLERAPSRRLKTLGDLRKNVPVWFWRQQKLKWRVGVDELNHGTSLSQWIVMLMLADALEGGGWSVREWQGHTAPSSRGRTGPP